MTTATAPSPASSQALTVSEQKNHALTSVRDLLTKSEQQLAMALPKGIPASLMIRVVLTAVQRTPDLLACHPLTLLGAVFQSAQLGLVPDGVLGQAYLVPFDNKRKKRMEVQFIPGYRGLITLVRRSGELSTIDAEVVHAKDVFVYERGTNPTLKHVPTDEADPGPMVKVWAAARLKDGGFQIVVLNLRQVNAIRSRSQAEGSKYSPWNTDPAWMWKKTALKQLCKLLPVSTETQRALALDDRHESGLPQDLALLADESEAPTVEEGDGAEGATEPTPAQVIAIEVGATEAEAFAIQEAFDALGWKPAQRLVQMKAFKGRAADLLSTLKGMVGPDAGAVIDVAAQPQSPTVSQPAAAASPQVELPAKTSAPKSRFQF